MISDINSVCRLEEAPGRCLTEICQSALNSYRMLLSESAPGTIPAKSEFDILRFYSVIPNIVMSSLTKPNQCIYRVAGEEVIKRIGFNPTGKNYFDFVPPSRLTLAIKTMLALIDVPCGLRVAIEQTYSTGLQNTIEVVLTPLKSDLPGVDGYILSAEDDMSKQEQNLYDGRVLLGKNVILREFIDLGFGVGDIIADLQQD